MSTPESRREDARREAAWETAHAREMRYVPHPYERGDTPGLCDVCKGDSDDACHVPPAGTLVRGTDGWPARGVVVFSWSPPYMPGTLVWWSREPGDKGMVVLEDPRDLIWTTQEER